MQCLPVQIEKRKAQHEQVYEQVHDWILSGKLVPGDKLPSTDQLAVSFKTHVPTVHRALTKLVKEGLLIRRPKYGTFVQKREEKLTCVGVYSGAHYAESQFGQAIQTALREELQRAGIEPDIWTDPRTESQRGEPWMPLVRAAKHREFQAVIVAGGQPDRLRWLRKLPVPVTARGGVPEMPSRVDMDRVGIADISLRALAEQGCRSAGVIMPVNPLDIADDGTPSQWMEFCERFLELAGELRMTVKNEWMRLLRQNVDGGSARAHEQYGYEEFLKIWSQPERPEGLVVYDDTTARGVILGVREQHVRVPEELKLVLHKNEATPLFCPMPATFMVLSEREIAHHLVAQMQKQFRGEPCEPISVPFRLMAHSGQSSR